MIKRSNQNEDGISLEKLLGFALFLFSSPLWLVGIIIYPIHLNPPRGKKVQQQFETLHILTENAFTKFISLLTR